jgi:hypothetical protein
MISVFVLSWTLVHSDSILVYIDPLHNIRQRLRRHDNCRTILGAFYDGFRIYCLCLVNAPPEVLLSPGADGWGRRMKFLLRMLLAEGADGWGRRILRK